MPKNQLREMNLYADGHSYVGAVTEYNPPNLQAETEEYRAGGMAGAVTFAKGLQALEASFTLGELDPDGMKLFQKGGTQFEIRGALQDLNGAITPFVHKLEGKVNGLEQSPWDPGSQATLGLSVSPHYYQAIHNGEVVHEIDMVNGVMVIGGVDRMAEIRAAIGT